MESTIEEIRKRRYQAQNFVPSKGEAPEVEFSSLPNPWFALRLFFWTFLAVFVTSWVALGWMGNNLAPDLGFALGFYAGLAASLAYYLAPLLHIAVWVKNHKQLPPRKYLESLPIGQKVAPPALISALLVSAFHYFFPRLIDGWWHLTVVTCGLTVVLMAVTYFLLPNESKSRMKPLRKKKPKPGENSRFSLWLGSSTGLLADLWHSSGIESGYEIALSAQDAAQNIVVLGGIGSGKTTRMMQPLLSQLLDQPCGGLIFDVKGDVKDAISELSKSMGREVNIIGPGHAPLNLLEGLTPETASSFLKSAFLLGGTQTDSFWVDTATELCRNTLGILSFLPNQYSLSGLFGYLFDQNKRNNIQIALKAAVTYLSEEDKRLLSAYQNYHEVIFDGFDEKVKSGVNATVAQVLSPFNHPELMDSFCTQSMGNPDMKSLLTGNTFLVDLPLARWGLGGKVAYTFIKLRFFNLMQNRNQQPESDQTLPVFFMCDEYQELISANKDGLSDLNFWDKSRSSQTIGIISAQSVSSFYAAIGNQDLAHAILQNFRQKICFRTEDRTTLTMMDGLVGRAKIKRKTRNQTMGQSRDVYDLFKNSQVSLSESITEAREQVLDATLFRDLKPNQAIALLSQEGESRDDVLELMPLYIEPEETRKESSLCS